MYSIINDGQMITNNINNSEPSVDCHVESGRGCRNKKKQMDPTCCPVCSVTLRVSELNSHLGMEMEKLAKLSNHKRSTTKTTSPISGPSVSTENTSNGWETYQKVRANRQGRLKSKSKKRKNDEMTCPVCNKVTSEDLTIHVEMCLQRMDTSEGNASDDEDTIDVEGDNGKFEEYEWAGQTRVRASSLLEGGFTGLGIGTSISKPSPAEEDADVIVDGDDTQIYGSPHYTEQDVLNTSMEDTTENETDNCLTKTKSDNNGTESLEETAKDVIIESLKMKIRELEDRTQIKEQYKCLICMGKYKNPVVSICCWHVHCEQCWLQTLSAKKICPQCNMITSVTELRRIFI